LALSLTLHRHSNSIGEQRHSTLMNFLSLHMIGLVPASPLPPAMPPSDPPQEWLADMEGLRALYESTLGRDWKLKANWMIGHPCTDSWQGVLCSPRGLGCCSSRVERLLLRDNGLQGTLPSELASLDALVELSLYDNAALSGTFPSATGTSVLRSLSVASTTLSGTLPLTVTGRGDAAVNPFAFLPPVTTALESLYAPQTLFSGTLPPSIGLLSSLRTLHLSSMGKLSGTLPPSIGDLPLAALQASRTRLSGILPPLAMLPLQHLLIDHAFLSGTIPPSLGSCPDVAAISLEFNRLSGSVPLELGGRCGQAFAYDLASNAPVHVRPGTSAIVIGSSYSDGLRSLQAPETPLLERRTYAKLGFRGNPQMEPNDETVNLANLADLTSHDLCSYSSTLVRVPVGASSETAILAGSIFEPPSLRAEGIGFPRCPQEAQPWGVLVSRVVIRDQCAL